MPDRRHTVESLAETTARHDEQIEGLIKAVQGLRDTQERGFSGLRTQIETMVRPQWQLYIGAAGLALGVTTLLLTSASAVGGVIMASIAGNQSRTERQVGDLSEKFIAHTSNGHPAAVLDRVTENTKKISQLDETLQREMRLINDTTRAMVENLDERLQREVKDIKDGLSERAVENRRAIERLQERALNGGRP